MILRNLIKLGMMVVLALCACEPRTPSQQPNGGFTAGRGDGTDFFFAMQHAEGEFLLPGHMIYIRNDVAGRLSFFANSPDIDEKWHPYFVEQGEAGNFRGDQLWIAIPTNTGGNTDRNRVPSTSRPPPEDGTEADGYYMRTLDGGQRYKFCRNPVGQLVIIDTRSWGCG